MVRIAIIIFILFVLLIPNLQAKETEINTESNLYWMLDDMTNQLVQILTNTYTTDIDSTLIDSTYIIPLRTFNVAIMSFDNIGPDAEEMKAGETVSEILTSTFTQKDNIILTERRRIADIIEEMKLSASGIVSAETALQVGELAGAEIMVTGSIVHAGQYFDINARILDVSTAKILGAIFLEIPDNEIIAASSNMYNIGKKSLAASFYSMLIPGMGQILINDHPKKGGFFFLNEMALLITALALNTQGNNEYEKYQENIPSTFKKYDTAQKYYQGANMALTCAGIVWFWNVLDAYSDARSFNKKVKESREETAYNFRKPSPFVILDKNNKNYLKMGINVRF